MTCVRCRDAEAAFDVYCGLCHVSVRLELAAGMKRLGEYLANWAAYVEWCAKRGVAS